MSKEEIDWNYRKEEYFALLHAVQTGVAFWMQAGFTDETNPKQLRVGVNSSLITSSALAKTLIEAGVIDYKKFRDNEILMLQEEVKSYERKLQKHHGNNVDIRLL